MNFIKEYWVALVVLVLVLIGSIILSQKDNKVTGTGPNQTMEQKSGNATTIEPVPTSAVTQESMTGNVWEGTLKTSDNSAKGNFVLVMTDHAIYIRTSRDYSELIGKEVLVSYSGSLENFVLMDIEPKK